MFKANKVEKNALLSHRHRDGARIWLCCFSFNGLKSACIKLQCFKKRIHATDVVPRLGTCSSFCPLWSFSTWFCLSFTPPWWRVKIAITQIMKRYYRKQCILWHHEINDRTLYEMIEFLFRLSDIYRHIAQPLLLCWWYLALTKWRNVWNA